MKFYSKKRLIVASVLASPVALYSIYTMFYTFFGWGIFGLVFFVLGSIFVTLYQIGGIYFSINGIIWAFEKIKNKFKQ